MLDKNKGKSYKILNSLGEIYKCILKDKNNVLSQIIPLAIFEVIIWFLIFFRNQKN